MILFEENIELLLESEDGPVGRYVEQKANEVRDLVRADVAMIMHRLPADKLSELLDQVQVDMEGSDAQIGFVNTAQSIVEYLATKSVNEQDKLTAGALRKVFPA